MSDARRLLEPILALHDRIRDSVVDACSRQATDELSAVDAEEASDTIYRIDRVSEDDAGRRSARSWRATSRSVSSPKDSPDGTMVLPRRCAGGGLSVARDRRSDRRHARNHVSEAQRVDSDRRRAESRRRDTRIRDIVLAVQTEIPLLKQHLCDQLWAVRGEGAWATRFNRITGEREPLAPHAVARRHDRARLREREPVLPRRARRARRDRRRDRDRGARRANRGEGRVFRGSVSLDGRPALRVDGGTRSLHRRHSSAAEADSRAARIAGALCCHPYDICTALIAEELGVIVTNAIGGPIDAPFDIESDVSWVGLRERRDSCERRARAAGGAEQARPAARALEPELTSMADQSLLDRRAGVVSRAPGRLDVMGGIADYSGAVVLQLPLDRATTVVLQQQDGAAVRCRDSSRRRVAALLIDLDTTRRRRA